MKALRRVAALLGRIGYALSRYRFFAMRLDLFAMAALALGSAYLAWRAGRQGLTMGYAAALLIGLLLSGGLWYVRHSGYAFFQPMALPEVAGPSQRVALVAEERLGLRGTGAFEVNDLRRRFVDLPMALWRTEMGDYILMGRYRVRPLPFLDRLEEEQGMWYAFFRPDAIQDVVTGRLGFGLAQRWAIRLRYRTAEPEKAEELYLSGDGPEVIQRLVAELARREAPASGARV